ncbi:Protein of unknown function (DUF3558) [Nocardia amikacinitolerans]|uniref:DUF3558 domain-containing protein n=1 Tax=Nocardia amikacinitolerans TaxID=756689 RepID=UPI00082D7C5A|nr:DUF3558 domain-containing protein [Nocardia amikacinitolerans]MCP2318315.1 Protein of unknown function (DUF3558) [Nocardia amikacinitolerans]
MRTADALRTAAAGAAVIGLVAGCGSTVGGTAATPTTTVRNLDEIEVFNPCTSLSEDALRATGADPASKDVVTDPPTGPAAWRICSWDSTTLPYFITVASSSHTIDEVRSNPDETGFREVPVGPRPGLIHQDKSDTRGLICRVAIPAEQGMFVISADWRASKPVTHDRCELAVQHAEDLEPHLPK